MKSPRSDIEFDSIKSIAAWTGFPESLFSQAKNSGQCPDAFAHSRIKLRPFLNWMAKASFNAEGLPAGFASWRDYWNKMGALREEIKLNKDKGTVLDLPQARQLAAEAEAWYFAELDRMKREVPASAAGRDAMGIYDVLDRFIDDLRKSSREKFQAVAEPQ